MMTPPVWQTLAAMGAGSLLMLAGFGWLISASADRYEGAPGGCLGRVITWLSMVSALGLLVMALTR